jgi:hypothetical protein
MIECMGGLQVLGIEAGLKHPKGWVHRRDHSG